MNDWMSILGLGMLILFGVGLLMWLNKHLSIGTDIWQVIKLKLSTNGGELTIEPQTFAQPATISSPSPDRNVDLYTEGTLLIESRGKGSVGVLTNLGVDVVAGQITIRAEQGATGVSA